ncbi:MAG: hypothetical protein ABF261_06110 [Candidatus Arcticimaribacter sp.]
MLNPIKKEIDRLAHEILAQDETVSPAKLLEKVQEIYKKLVLLEHYQDQNITPEEEMQKQEVIPVMETINELVTELPLEEESAAIEDLFASVSNPVFIKKEEKTPLHDIPVEKPQRVTEETLPKNLNDVLGKGVQIGLNDRLAFIKNLFDDSAEDYQRVISQVQTMSSWEEAQSFIEQMVKPEYNQWEGKEAFETRFYKCLESNF